MHRNTSTPLSTITAKATSRCMNKHILSIPTRAISSSSISFTTRPNSWSTFNSPPSSSSSSSSPNSQQPRQTNTTPSGLDPDKIKGPGGLTMTQIGKLVQQSQKRDQEHRSATTSSSSRTSKK